jgi:hypothetical protein
VPSLLLVHLVLVLCVAAVHRVLERLDVLVQVSGVALRRLLILGGHATTVRLPAGRRGNRRETRVGRHTLDTS